MSRRVALRHLPFFDRLTRTDESSSEWRATSAGLVMLRLVDAWIEEGPDMVRGGWSARAAREAIESVDPGTPARAILGGIVDVLVETRSVDPRVITPRLLAYGQSLALDADYDLAADVFETVTAHARPLEEPDLVIDAYIQLGAVRRTLGDLDAAAAAYAAAGELAAEAADTLGLLRVELAGAKLAVDRGNLPEAERMLDGTIAAANRSGHHELASLARHQRSAVFFQRKEYERAIRDAFEALGGLQSTNARDRALADVAAAFAELGCRSVARDAHLILAATAQEQHVRWTALINLMEIAALDGREPVFEQYRRELSTANLPAALSAWYQLYAGQGLRAFGRIDAARRALRQAVEIAERHRLNQAAFQAEETLASLEAAARRDGHVESPLPGSLWDVAAELRAMRERSRVG